MGKEAARMLIDTAAHLGPILTGSPNVFIGGMMAAKKGDIFMCTSHGIGTINEGEPTVLINGIPAARKGDSTSCTTIQQIPVEAKGAPPVHNFVTAAKNVDEAGNVKSNAPDWARIDTKAFYAGYDKTDENKDGTYDQIKFQAAVLDFESNFGNGYIGAGLDAELLNVEGRGRAGWGNGYYGIASEANAKVIGFGGDIYLGSEDNRIAYAEANVDVLYAEHEATAEVYAGGEEKKWGIKVRSTEQAGLLKAKAGVGTDVLSSSSDKTKNETKDGNTKVTTEKTATGANAEIIVGGVGWDLGAEAYLDMNEYALVAKLDLGGAFGLGGKLDGSINIGFKPIVDFWNYITGNEEEEEIKTQSVCVTIPGEILTGCSTVLIGK